MSHQFETEGPPNLHWHQFSHQLHLVTTGVLHHISIVYYCPTTHTTSMARNKSHKSHKALHTSLIAQRKNQNQIFTLLAAVAVGVVTKLVAPSICATPMNTYIEAYCKG